MEKSKFLFYLIYSLLMTVASSLVLVGSQTEEQMTPQELERELLDPWTVNVRCSPSQMCIFLNKQWLEKRWDLTDYRKLSLRSVCNEALQHNRTHVMLCTESGYFLTCGTRFEVNSTHVIYSNNVTVADESDDNIIVSSPVHKWFPWKCMYPLHVMVGIRFNPIISPITHFLGSKIGEGEFKVAMFLYKDESYDFVHETAPILQADDKLLVQILLIDGPPPAKLEAVKCWATPIQDPDSEQYFPFIENYCPLVSMAEVVIKENGLSDTVRFESKVFGFINSTRMFLHCNVKVCFEDDCEKSCDVIPSRRRRDVSDDVVVSLGPIEIGDGVPIVQSRQYLQKEDPTAPPIATTTEEHRVHETSERLFGLPKVGVYVIIVVLVLLALLFVTSAIICIIRKKQAIKSLEITSKRRLHKSSSITDTADNRSVFVRSQFEIPIAVN